MKKIAENYNNHVVNLLGAVTIKEPMLLIIEFVEHGDLLSYLRYCHKRVGFKARYNYASINLFSNA